MEICAQYVILDGIVRCVCSMEVYIGRAIRCRTEYTMCRANGPFTNSCTMQTCGLPAKCSLPQP